MQNIFNRMAVILLSFGFCAFVGMAQNTLSEKIDHVFETQDMEAGLKLYNEITDADLRQLHDSTLFDYHYLAGYINSKIPDHEKAISHLTEAKRLCDTSLGVLSNNYINIMLDLGDEYVALEQYDNARAIYEEGIVKTYCIRKSINYGLFFIKLGKSLKHKGEYWEIPNMYKSAWQIWNREFIEFSSYSYEPLIHLEWFYYQNRFYEDALATNNDCISFITQNVGSNHTLMAEEYYFRASLLGDMGEHNKSIDYYNKGYEILKKNRIKFNDLYLRLLTGSISEYVYINNNAEVASRIKALKKQCNQQDNDEVYQNKLQQVSQLYYQRGEYNQALHYNKELLKTNAPDNIKSKAIRQNDIIIEEIALLESLSSLEAEFQATSIESSDWFDLANKLAHAYFVKHDKIKYRNILERLYNELRRINFFETSYQTWLLDQLYKACFKTEDYQSALKYAQEKFVIISKEDSTTDESFYLTFNNIIDARIKIGSTEDGNIDTEINSVDRLYKRNLYEKDINKKIEYHKRLAAVYEFKGQYGDALSQFSFVASLETSEFGAPFGDTINSLINIKTKLTNVRLN